MIRIILFLLILVLSPGAWAAGTAGEGGGQFTSDDPAYAEAIQAIKAQEFDRAARLLQDVVDRNPDNIDALSSLGYANTRLGRYDQAKRRYARALALQPGHLGANEYLGELHVRQGNLAAAVEQLNTVRNICGQGCEEYQDLARAIAGYRKTGRFEEHNKGTHE